MKIQLGLFFGGKSVEHEVAVISAMQTYAALDKEKYDVYPVYISKNNEMYTGELLTDVANFKDLDSLLSKCTGVVLKKNGKDVELIRYPGKKFGNNVITKLDVAFPVVHGTNCEDGTVEGFLSMFDLPVVGADVCSSAVCMDKWISKCVLKEAGIPVLEGISFFASEYFKDQNKIIEKITKAFGFPVIVKPVNLGSSVGISKAMDKDEFITACDLACSFAGRILVEPLVTNMKEINCAVLGDSDEAIASTCEEPVASGAILTYADKYQDNGGSKGGSKGASGSKTSSGMTSLKRKLPAEITDEEMDFVKKTAVEAFKVLNLSGVTRIDFIKNLDTGKIFINELNTIPGSLSFYLWEYDGKSFKELTDDLVKIALKNHRAKEKLVWSNEVNLLSSFAPVGKASKR